jgi:hypothetical protein
MTFSLDPGIIMKKITPRKVKGVGVISCDAMSTTDRLTHSRRRNSLELKIEFIKLHYRLVVFYWIKWCTIHVQ